MFAHKVKGSKNWNKQRIKVARTHMKVGTGIIFSVERQ